MTPTAIEEIFQRHPETPLKFTLSSGDQITIPHANAAVISVTHIYLYPNLKGRFSADFGKYVSLVNVAMIEPLSTPENSRSSDN